MRGSVKNNFLSFDFASDLLTGDFVTKTDPDYFRYMSIGKGKMRIGNEEKNIDIIVDNVISHDNSHARLSPGTKVKSYMGNIWDNHGNSTYFDISEVGAK